MSYISIQSLSELKQVLKSFSIDTSFWNAENGCKTVEDLFAEISNGERKLRSENNVLYLETRVLCAVVWNESQTAFLKEAKIEYPNGVCKQRGYSHISEKFLPNETVETASIRAISEELGLIIFPNAITIEKKTSTTKPSQYGIIGRYILHHVKVILKPDQIQDQYIEVQKNQDGSIRKKVYFVWDN